MSRLWSDLGQWKSIMRHPNFDKSNSRQQHSGLFCRFLRQHVHLLEPDKYGDLLPCEQRASVRHLRSWNELRGGVLRLGRLLVPHRELHRWSEHLRDRPRGWQVGDGRRVAGHICRIRSEVVSTRLQSKEAQGVLLQSKLPEEEREEECLQMDELSHR